MPTGPLAVALSGADAGSFTASPASLGSLPVSGSGSFTVAPKPSLAVKAYAATVTVTGGNGISASFNVSFTVNVSTAAAITGFRSPAAATASVGNGVSSLAVDITVSPGAAWELFSDLACTRPITSKTMSLAVGDNTAYIRVTAQDGTTRAVYPLTVTRAAAPRILTTRYESNLGNWLLFIFCFGWIWMWF
ncbi:MAG: cadherin-like beta sandwich domain-containing protein [Oscillospiraceae bacterium]|nr:cadherin-like beta sandwich domain-containing protein [Oscillospiraceae bacterium]